MGYRHLNKAERSVGRLGGRAFAAGVFEENRLKRLEPYFSGEYPGGYLEEYMRQIGF